MTDAAPHRVRSEAKAPSHLYLEDFAVGQVYEAGPIPVSADAIKAYAHQFDPQPFHTDAELARSTFFQGLVASGWHTASLTMSLVVQALPIAGGVIGGGVDELRWPKPLRPGDELRLDGDRRGAALTQQAGPRSRPGSNDDAQPSGKGGADHDRQPRRAAPSRRAGLTCRRVGHANEPAPRSKTHRRCRSKAR